MSKTTYKHYVKFNNATILKFSSDQVIDYHKILMVGGKKFEVYSIEMISNDPTLHRVFVRETK